MQIAEHHAMREHPGIYGYPVLDEKTPLQDGKHFKNLTFQ
jgi:hypothetical protein